jgi:ABC-2 type transport system ATP-binding protein
MSNTMISVNNLTKYYGEVHALDSISFEVAKGEILGLLGPNGAGKSTTMRIITCYLPATSGQVRINDIDILEDPVGAKRLMGYLPEFAPFYPDMLVYDYLKYVAAIRDMPAEHREDRITELVDICGLKGMMHRPFRELSRGYKQRVGLAHALMSDPEILVLDEPTSGLDPNQIVDIRSIIKEIGREKTIIFSTHILSEAEATCDRVVIINQGKIVADGTADDIKSSATAGHRYRLSLINARFADVKGYLVSIPGVEDIRQISSDDPEELRLELICSSDNRKEISGQISQQDWSIVEFTKERASLEGTFRELTSSEESAKRNRKKHDR